MQTQVEVLSKDELEQVHERSLRILMHTGVRVDSSLARKILGEAGAQIDENKHLVRFPPTLVEECLKVTPRYFTLGGRRSGWYWPMNNNQCTLLADGEASRVVNADTGERRAGTEADWLKATQLIDAMDEIGVYWRMVSSAHPQDMLEQKVRYWRSIFTHFSKHVQEATETPEQTRWLLELLQIIFGGKEAIRELKPLSFLLTPVSPLIFEATYTDAYLEMIDWGIPVAVMPMPIMGLTSPARLIATTLQGNCETLAMLCLIQAAAPGTPFIYAPALSVSEPRTGRYTGGAVEHALLAVCATQMGRFYNLPVEASTGGSHQYQPGIQAGYERAINWTLPSLAWPDILVGPGLFEGSTVLCFEQLWLDVEVFRHEQRVHTGVSAGDDQWLEDVIAMKGPGGNFLTHPTTRNALHLGEWRLGGLGEADIFPAKRNILEEVRAKIDRLLEARQPLPLDNHVVKELDQLERRALVYSNQK